jgi:hypothetical protein
MAFIQNSSPEMKGLTIEPTIATNAIADPGAIENVFHVPAAIL